jgi:transcriptional regulator with XRE-family HTH domain
MNRAVDIGRERARFLAIRYGKELRIARVGVGLSQRHLALRAGVSQGFVSLVERGMRQPRWDVACRLSAACGYELGLKLYPADGLRLRDSGQMALANPIASRAHPTWGVRLEVPIGDGSRRAVDIGLDRADERAIIEIERGLADFQSQYRAAALKRDALAAQIGQPVRLIIGVPDTRATRRVLAEHADLIRRVLPTPSRSIWRALEHGTPIGSDGVLFIPSRRVSQGNETHPITPCSRKRTNRPNPGALMTPE